MPTHRVRRCTPALLALAAACLAPAAGRGQDRAVVGRATSPAGTFSLREPQHQGFRVLPAEAEVASGDLLVTLPGATLVGKGGAVQVKSLADFDERSPFPVVETAYTVTEAADVDLDLTLDRGRVDLANARASGPAVVRVHFWDQSWSVTLEEPGARVALELYARWPAGARFRHPPPADADRGGPVASLVLLVIKGAVSTKVDGGRTFGLKAPPGLSLLEWDSVVGGGAQPKRLEKLPAWADPEAGLAPEGRKVAEAIEKFREARVSDPSGSVRKFLESDDPVEQRVALVTLGATDELEMLLREMSRSRSAVKWDYGARVLRHWVGRRPGQDQKLYEALVSPVFGLPPAHARTVLKLVLGFSAEDFQKPETYEVLIDCLTHEQPAVRSLAAWHLVRAVPQGKAIEYAPGGGRDECEKAAQAWKKLVPAGQLPPPAAKPR